MSFAFTTTLVDPGNRASSDTLALMKADIDAAVRMFGSYFTGLGTIDITATVVDSLGTLLASAGAAGLVPVASGSTTYVPITVYELLNGTDRNGSDADVNIKIDASNLSQFWFDPTPNDLSDGPPADKYDFFSIMLHELGHAFGITGFRNVDGGFTSSARSVFDNNTRIAGSTATYDSAAARAANGGNPVDLYAQGESGTRWVHVTTPSDAMYYAGTAGQRKLYSAIDIAFFHDQGLVSATPGSGNDIWFGTTRDETIDGGAGNDQLFAMEGNDRLTGSAGNDTLSGGAGYDTAVFAARRSAATIQVMGNGSIVVTSAEGTDTLWEVEALQFADTAMFALAGSQASVARLYGAAFARAPDAAGLGVQLGALSGGVSALQLASNFIGSAEFKARYGASPSDTDFVKLLYNNVLGRDPDAGGYAVQTDALAHGLSRQQMLLNFADSAENKAKVLADWMLLG